MSLQGDDFREKWRKLGADALLHFVSEVMPVGGAGSLERGDYIASVNDIIAVNDLGPLLDDQSAETKVKLPEAVLKMEAEWAARFPINYDAIANAELKRRSDLLAQMSPVDQAMLEKPDDQDWLHWRRTYDGIGFSPLTQIDRNNVSELDLAWALALPFGTNAITPLVHDGVVFINSNGTVRAIEGSTGDVIWQFARTTERRMQSSQPRSMAMSGSTIFVPTSDLHMIALDARTGEVLWDHAIEPKGTPFQLTAGPLIVRDKVIQGVSGCVDAANVGGCFIVAMDKETGKELWRFYTIARPGEPGGDSWNGAPLERRFGASVWSTASYDPELNLVFVGASQTYNVSALIEKQARKGKSADGLYTNSTLALNPDTGKLHWYYQHFAAEALDLDWAFERTIVKLPTASGERKLIVTAGKLGIFDVIDAQTGQYVFSHDLGLQNVVASIDPETGGKTTSRSALLRQGEVISVCPSALGVRNWPATAYDPQTHIIYVPASEGCMDVSYAPDKDIDMDFVHHTRPDSDGMIGRVAALNLATREPVWTIRRRASEASAILATAGGLIFEGSRDRWFHASDSMTGEVLWQRRLDGVPHSFPISFAVDDVQYVAVTTGGGTPIDTFWRPFTPEIIIQPDATTLWVFRLRFSKR